MSKECVFVAPPWCLVVGRYVRMRGCPKNVICGAPVVIGSRKVCKDEGVPKEWYLERPVVIGSGAIHV